MWAITAEQIHPYTKKESDLLVERASLAASLQSSSRHTVSMTLHLTMELEKQGQRIEDALGQLCESLEETIDKNGNTENPKFEIFAVEISGLEIGFFEFHMDISN